VVRIEIMRSGAEREGDKAMDGVFTQIILWAYILVPVGFFALGIFSASFIAQVIGKSRAPKSGKK
jgi:hypothetical protein